MRNLNSLNGAEQLAYLQLPLEDSSKSSTTTAPVESKKRKRARLKASIDSKVEAQLLEQQVADKNDDMESEVQESMPTKQEREATLREEAEEAVLERTLLATTAAFRAKPKREVTEEERKAIADDVDAILNLQLAALEKEYALAEGVCYMQQEMFESKDSQDDQVQFHRFGLVTPGAQSLRMFALC